MHNVRDQPVAKFSRLLLLRGLGMNEHSEILKGHINGQQYSKAKQQKDQLRAYGGMPNGTNAFPFITPLIIRRGVSRRRLNLC